MATAAAIQAGVAIIGGISSRNSSRRAADAETRGQDLAAQQVERATREARDAAIPLFESAQQNALAGFRGSLDLLQQIAPQQQQFAQQGNIGARETLLGGQQQFQNAILGGNVDLSGLRRAPLALPGASLFQQQLPDFTSISDALGLGGQQQSSFPTIPNFPGGGPINTNPGAPQSPVLFGGNDQADAGGGFVPTGQFIPELAGGPTPIPGGTPPIFNPGGFFLGGQF